MKRSPAEALLAALPEAVSERLACAGELDAWLLEVVGEARAACPGVDVADTDFAPYLATKITSLPDLSFRQLKTIDLYLAFACSERHDAALALFEERYFGLLARTLERMGLSASAAEEYRAALRETLFFSPGEPAPLIRAYSGRGDLGGWLRSIATRGALKIRGKEEKNVPTDAALDLVPAEDNPEIQYLRSRYTREFQVALVGALESLSTRERNLLRQHYLDGLSIEAVGRLYRVHRATAARWLADVREAVLVRVKENLRVHGALTDTELESMVRMARSGFDMSISTLLRRC